MVFYCIFSWCITEGADVWYSCQWWLVIWQTRYCVCITTLQLRTECLSPSLTVCIRYSPITWLTFLIIYLFMCLLCPKAAQYNARSTSLLWQSIVVFATELHGTSPTTVCQSPKFLVASICDLSDFINCQFREFVTALLGPVHFLSQDQQ